VKESIVQIGSGRYRYHYDPDTKATVYDGPVGSAPAISEAEFNMAVAVTPDGLASLIMGIDTIAEDEVMKLPSYHTKNFRMDIEQQEVWMNVVTDFIESQHSDKYPNEVFSILEDKNYHHMNDFLARTGRFEDMSEFAGYRQSMRDAQDEPEGISYSLQLYFTKHEPDWFEKYD